MRPDRRKLWCSNIVSSGFGAIEIRDGPPKCWSVSVEKDAWDHGVPNFMRYKRKQNFN